MSTARPLRTELLQEQLQSLLGFVRGAGEELNAQDRLHLARATALLVDSSRIEEGLPTEIGVVRNVTCLEDALQLLVEDAAEAEET
jgi:hypothetical protein